jgi:hypothetical protein
MIIRRLASALKSQDWFQVVIEIFIVVIGIFLGLQVTDWNDERAERLRERVYLERLHGEVMDASDFRKISFEGVILTSDIVEIDQTLGQILGVFEGTDTSTTLGPRHCFEIMGSHIYNDQTVDVPTLRELSSSGQLGLIKNENIKLSISQFTFGMDALRTLVAGLVPSALVMARKYPDLIQLDRNMRNIQNRDGFNHQCNFEQMRDNIRFNNDLIDNATRMKAFATASLKIQELLDAIHTELDNELSITHEEPGL